MIQIVDSTPDAVATRPASDPIRIVDGTHDAVELLVCGVETERHRCAVKGSEVDAVEGGETARHRCLVKR